MRKRYVACVLTTTAALCVAVPTLNRPATAESNSARNFAFTLMTGNEEVPPVATDGFGVTAIRENQSANALLFALFTFGLKDMTQAHIHLGEKGENGPPVAFLFESQDAPVTNTGPLSVGLIRAGDLIGPLAGQPLSALTDAIASGNAYVNLHTVAHPPGEVRGQLRAVRSPVGSPPD